MVVLGVGSPEKQRKWSGYLWLPICAIGGALGLNHHKHLRCFQKQHQSLVVQSFLLFYRRLFLVMQGR